MLDLKWGKFLTADEVARILRIPESSMRYFRRAHKEELPHCRIGIGRRVLYKQEDVAAYIAAHVVEP